MNRTIATPTHRVPTTVGEMLEEEFRKPLNLTQAAFAEALGIDRVRYSAIVNGRSLPVDTAQRLARVLGTSIEFWLNLQHMTDVYNAIHEDPSPEIAKLVPIAHVWRSRR
jgi:addiction module HigA family antidote